jgi:Trypsin-co-occurring domain 2
MTLRGSLTRYTVTRTLQYPGSDHDRAYMENAMRITDEGVQVDTLISVVKDSIKRAGVSRTSQTRDLQVASVKLILDVVASKTAGGGVNFCVPFIGMNLRAGARVTKKNTHTIDINLMPPKERDTRQVRGGEVEAVLVNAIATIRDVMTKAAEGDDPWLLSASTIDISFAITQTGTITLGIDGDLANEVTHTLRLGLAPGPS